MSKKMNPFPPIFLLYFVLTIALLPTAQSIAQERPDNFVEIRSVVPSIVVDLRYFSAHNFIGKPIEGYKAEKCFLTRKAALALQAVQNELRPFNFSLKIYDAYRPQRAVNHFIRWAKNRDDTTMRTEFYPMVEKKYLFRDGYIAARSSHTRRSTVDSTIVPLTLPEQPDFTPGEKLCSCKVAASQRFADNSIDMGTGYDCFDTLSWTADTTLSTGQRANRLLLKTVMEKHGFKNYSREWWHFTLRDEPFPETYFDFEIK